MHVWCSWAPSRTAFHQLTVGGISTLQLSVCSLPYRSALPLWNHSIGRQSESAAARQSEGEGFCRDARLIDWHKDGWNYIVLLPLFNSCRFSRPCQSSAIIGLSCPSAMEILHVSPWAVSPAGKPCVWIPLLWKGSPYLPAYWPPATSLTWQKQKKKKE